MVFVGAVAEHRHVEITQVGHHFAKCLGQVQDMNGVVIAVAKVNAGRIANQVNRIALQHAQHLAKRPDGLAQ